MGGRKEREKEGRVRSVRPFRSGELTVVEVALNVVDDEPGSKEQEDEKRGEKKMKMSFPNDSHDKSLKGGRKKKEKKRRGSKRCAYQSRPWVTVERRAETPSPE
jgi:hypothetical protein